MYLINDAHISLTGPLPNEAKAKIRDLFLSEGMEREATCDNDSTGGYISVEEAYGDICGLLNDIVDILKPYGIAPRPLSFNKYWGENDGYDVFIGERFRSMDAEDFGLYTAADETLIGILESRGYVVTLSKQEVSV